jgi:chemotaxis protein methyltransferase CheR
LSIHFEDKENIRHINVIAMTSQKNEIGCLELLLSKESFRHHEIYFYDTDILSAKVVELIAHNLERKNVKVYVQKKCLHDYLIRLGVFTTLIKNFHFNKKKEQDHSFEIVGSTENKRVGEMYIQENTTKLLELIYNKYGYDFKNYQSGSMIRRINAYLNKERQVAIGELTQKILKDEESVNELLSGLTVNTTEFFRNGDVYKHLRNKILPYLNSYASIKIWCAGCSTGQEAYSLAILLEEEGMLDKSFIYATDISFNNIQQAKNGLYSIEDIKKGIKNYLEAGGRNGLLNTYEEHGTYVEMKRRYMEHILFFQHSLVESGVINEFQLILCRNVLMYFNNVLQEKVLKLFCDSMDISGFLVLGKSEGILVNSGRGYFDEIDTKNKIYKRKINNNGNRRGK